MKTALIILNYNNYEDTINCIESVEKYNTSPIKYIIVDNGSTRSNTIQTLDKYLSKRFSNEYILYNENETPKGILPKVCLLSSQTNDGYAQGNNKGLTLAYADEEIDKIMILNNDILFIEDILDRLIYQLNNLPQCAIVSPILYKKDMYELDHNCARLNHSNWEIINTYMMLYKDCFGYITRQNNKRYILLNHSEYATKNYIEIELPSGSCMLMNKSFIKSINSFDPHTFLYFEENILYKKTSKLGLKNYLIPSCKCIHLGASSTKKTSSIFIDMEGIKSANYYLKKYCTFNLIQKICWNLAIFLFKFKLFLKKNIYDTKNHTLLLVKR